MFAVGMIVFVFVFVFVFVYASSGVRTHEDFRPVVLKTTALDHSAILAGSSSAKFHKKNVDVCCRDDLGAWTVFFIPSKGLEPSTTQVKSLALYLLSYNGFHILQCFIKGKLMLL